MRVRLAYGRSRVRSSGPATFFRWDIGHEMISSAILSLPLIQEGQLPRNSVVTLTDRLDMTIVVGEINPQIKRNKHFLPLFGRSTPYLYSLFRDRHFLIVCFDFVPIWIVKH